jgi:hypothetical protein
MDKICMMVFLLLQCLGERLAACSRPSRQQVNIDAHTMLLLPLFSHINDMKTQDLLILCSQKNHTDTCAATVTVGVTMAILKNSSENPAAFALMTQSIREDHEAQNQRRAAKDSMLGRQLRRNSLAFAGAPERAEEENLPRDVYLPGLTAAYPVFVIGIVLAIYGTDENGEPSKVMFLF